MIQIDMGAPATLCRMADSSTKARPGQTRDSITVARGPFLIMAHGYLAQSPADRHAFWIRSEQRNVMPTEIEETMRCWNDHSTDADSAAAVMGASIT